MAVMAIFSALVPALAGAAEPDQPASAIASEPQTAPVLVDGYELFSVVGVSAYPAERRAQEIADRIAGLAKDPAFDPSTIELDKEQDTIVIVGGQTRIMAVFEQDAAAEGMATRIVALAMSQRIRESIETYRQERSPDYIVESVLVMLAVLAGVVAVFWALQWLLRRLLRLMEGRYRARIRKLEARSSGAVEAEQFWRVIKGLAFGIWWVLLLVVVSVAADVSLQRLPWTRVVSYWFRELVQSPIQTMITAVVEAIPDLIFLTILALLIRYFLRVLQAVFMSIAQGTMKFAGLEADTAIVTYRLLRYGIIAFSLVVAYPYIPGSGSDAFKGISVFTGVLLSIGASSIIANTMAGYMLIYRKAFREGDLVRIGAHIGKVEAIRQQVTVLCTPKNEQVVIPNSVILSAETINYSARVKAGRLILHSTVTIGYDAPWRQVEALLLQAADRTPGLLKDPKPFVLKRELGDFYVSYEINAYSDSAEKMLQTYSTLHENILDLFNEHDVQIMSPHFERQPAEPVLVPKERWFARPAAPAVGEKNTPPG